MENIINSYKSRINTHEAEVSTITKQLRLSSLVRLVIFVIAIAVVYFLWLQWLYVAIVFIATIALFLFLVSRHEDLKQKRAYHQQVVEINERELRVLNREYNDLPDGAEHQIEDHEYSRDIDLLGAGSFYQYINRTALKNGSEALIEKLLANQTNDIVSRQQAVEELADQLDYRQEFEATARLLDNKIRPVSVIDWIKDYKPFVPQIFSWLGYLQFALSVLSIVLYSLDLISGYWIVALLLLGLGITGKYVARIVSLDKYLSELEGFFLQYGKLLQLVENLEVKSEVLINLRKEILTDGKPASKRLLEFSKAVTRLDQGSNMLLGIFVNGFGLYNLKQVHSIESWIMENKQFIKPWLDTVAQLDAISSLGNFAYNHPDYVFPDIKSGDFELKSKDAAHPLLDPEKAIGNDIHISQGEFYIITGANMAGKSTFLRTVSISIIMANVGLPLCAKQATYAPIKLITSMRTSDSLQDDESYFFSELKRLKYIVDKLEDEKYLIVLDEILKGTNSVDKASGSRKLIERLTQNKATGIIATHDLSLTEVAHEYEKISNYYFDAQIINDELFFDYTFKDGVAQNMNASFLLKKMGIV
ncbi:MutS-related protein [Nonlabens ponticola]|uniref:DNA mismatch repair protein MutS n=1 Tax=Nonlabens ponticola TaxID=2496866 RepID=A0A3S9MUL8_9FLAO|nr:DNA mismatch repair protein MutS [Nonlabens ponticola]AZQ42872.1 DNA mismatch repair protein MutS [Nonlabens ponticola]